MGRRQRLGKSEDLPQAFYPTNVREKTFEAMNYIRLFHIALLWLLCASSRAQVADASCDLTPSSTLGELVIIGEWSIYPLLWRKDSLDYKRQGAASLGEVLERKGLANTLLYGPQGSVITARINGSAPDHTAIFFNGVSINSPSLGLADLSLVPMSAFGNSSFQQNGRSQEGNQGGMSASVALNPRFSRKNSLQLSSGYTSMHNAFGIAQGVWYTNTFKLTLYAQHEVNDNEFAYTDVHQLRSPRIDQHHNNSKQTALLSNVEYRINNAMVARAFLWWQRRASNLPSIMGSESSGTANQTDSLWRAGTELVWRNIYNPSMNWHNAELKWRATWIQDHQVYRDLMQVSDPPQWMVSSMQTRMFVNEIAGSIEYKLWSFSGNVRYQAQQVFNSNYQNGEHSEPFQSFFANAGRRFNYEDESQIRGYYYQEWRAHYYASPSYGISVLLAAKKRPFWKPRLEFGVSNKFRIPDLNERYWVPGGSTALKPERGLAGFVNFNWKYYRSDSRVWTTTLESRYAHFNDWIQWVPTTSGYWQPVNYKQVLTWSSTFSSDYKISWRKNYISVQGRYQFTHSTNDHNQFMPYTPMNTVVGSVDFARDHWDVGVAFRWYDERYSNEANSYSQRMPSYGLTDVFAGYSFGKKKWIELRVSVQNVMDVDYQSIRSYAMPGRAVGVQLNMNPIK